MGQVGDGLCCTAEFSTQARQGLFGLEVVVLTSTNCVSDSENPFNIEGDMGVTVNGHGFSFGGDEDVLTLTVVTDSCTNL